MSGRGRGEAVDWDAALDDWYRPPQAKPSKEDHPDYDPDREWEEREERKRDANIED